jgi:hypothetical protein
MWLLLFVPVFLNCDFDYTPVGGKREEKVSGCSKYPEETATNVRFSWVNAGGAHGNSIYYRSYRSSH